MKTHEPNEDGRLAPARALLHPGWLAALAVLVINDHLLKATEFAPFLTGKLSDFAGILVATVLAAALVRAKRRRTVWLTAAVVGGVFAAINIWPAAADLWDASMAAIGSPWQTVTDPTDLVALAAIPVAIHWIPTRAKSETGQGRRKLQWALAAGAGLACLASGPNPNPRPAFEGEARVKLLNKSHELQAFRVRYLASDVNVDCDRIAEAPQHYLRPDAFGEATRWMLFSGQQMGLGVEGTGAGDRRFGGGAPSLGSDECQAAWVAVETAPDVVVFWDGSLEPQQYRRNPEADKGDLGGSQTVSLVGDYEDVPEDQMKPFKWRPCDDDDICGFEERRERAAELPDDVRYEWDSQDGAGLYFEMPDRTDRSESDTPESCRAALDRAGIAWEELPSGERRVVQVDASSDGCHTLHLVTPGAPEDAEPTKRLLCAPISALRHLRPEGDDDVIIDPQQIGRLPSNPAEKRYAGLRLDLFIQSDPENREGKIFLTRGTRLPEPVDVEVEARPLEGCGPSEMRCAQIRVPARLNLSSGAETGDVAPGEFATFTEGDRREVHVMRASERPVSRPPDSDNCEDAPSKAEELLAGRPGAYFEAASIIGLERPQ